MIRRVGRRALIALMALGVVTACSPRPTPAPEPVTVFAAASLTDALGAIAQDYERETGQSIRLSFAGSGSIARQVEAGAPADVVLLADRQWMDRLQGAGAIKADSRRDLLGNRLVVVAASNARIEGDPLAWVRTTQGRLAIGDPDSVPAGAYAREWLTRRGLWDGLQPSLVMAGDVRAVLAFVARGEAQLGIVYASDARSSDAVRIVFEPPAAEQPEIVYPAALTPSASPAAARFLDHLRSPAAQARFEQFGFETLG